MGEGAGEVYDSLRMEGNNPKAVLLNDIVNAAFERKEVAWKVLGTRDEAARERCTEVYKIKREYKRFIYEKKKEMNE